jgi:DNA transformation protein and related proteins
MDNADIEDMFASLSPITIKRMFGGKGIYHAGEIFAIEIDGAVLLKADAETKHEFEAAGAVQWVYQSNRSLKPVAMPYWSIPEDAYDDPDVMAKWVRLAYEAALRARK